MRTAGPYVASPIGSGCEVRDKRHGDRKHVHLSGSEDYGIQWAIAECGWSTALNSLRDLTPRCSNAVRRHPRSSPSSTPFLQVAALGHPLQPALVRDHGQQDLNAIRDWRSGTPVSGSVLKASFVGYHLCNKDFQLNRGTVCQVIAKASFTGLLPLYKIPAIGSYLFLDRLSYRLHLFALFYFFSSSSTMMKWRVQVENEWIPDDVWPNWAGIA